jgi:hypothetical protein
MPDRILAVLFPAGTTATLAAQTTLSFETCGNNKYPDAGSSIATAAQLYIDGKLVVDNSAQCVDSSPCWDSDSYVQTTQTLSAGSHDLVFKIRDEAGAVYEAQKTITVN